MAETSSEVSSRSHWHASVERCQLLKNISGSDVFGISEANVVNRLIKHSKLELTHVVNTRVFVLGGCKLVTHVLAKRFLSLIVARELPEDNLLPDEVLKHLRGSLNEISLNGGSSKLDMLGASADHVHDMPELMEECDNVIMGQKGRSVLSCLGEVADTGCNRHLPSVLELIVQETATGLEGEASSMAVLSFTREQIEVEIAHQSLLRSCFSVVYSKHSNAGCPHLRFILFNKLEVESVLIEFQKSR